MRRTCVALFLLVGCDSDKASKDDGETPEVAAKSEAGAEAKAPAKAPAKSAAEAKAGPEVTEDAPEKFGQMSKPSQGKPEPEPEVAPEPEVVHKERPRGLPGPTEAELRAWDREDPAGEKHLYKWDEDNFDDMADLWQDLVCMRDEVMTAGEKAFGAKSGSPEEETWFQFKRTFIVRADSWQKRMFADNPRIIEKSKFVGNFLEAHEIIMTSYPRAYNEADRKAVDEASVQWNRVEAKAIKYTKALGKDWPDFEGTEAAKEAHRAHCDALAKKK